jgi:protein O-mannosyl-transferase
MPVAFSKKIQTGVFFIYLLIAFIVYLPVLGKNFSADDFQVVYRVSTTRHFILEGFFRPLSDITLYFNYLLGGYNPVYYYSFNLLLHVCGGFLLFLFCRKAQHLFQVDAGYFPVLCGLLFIIYPFHNEAIVWAVGRGASLATVFALAAMLVAVSNINERWKCLIVAVFYFIGLTAYETVFPLPLMIVVILWKRKLTSKQWMMWLTLLLLALALHFVLRKQSAGSMLGGYGEGVFSLTVGEYAEHLFKILGRLFLPPMQNPGLMTALFVLLIIALIGLSILYVRRTNTTGPLVTILLLLFISMIVPVVFPVSTRTSETDRLLYFPSVFVCILIALLLLTLLQRTTMRYAGVAIVSIYFLVFLQLNNRNWQWASAITDKILSSIRENSGAGKMYIINLPDEYNGAFIFRLGFEEALMINGIDTARVKKANILYRDEAYGSPVINEPVFYNGLAEFYPAVKVSPAAGGRKTITGRSFQVEVKEGEAIWYWNNVELKKLQ